MGGRTEPSMCSLELAVEFTLFNLQVLLTCGNKFIRTRGAIYLGAGAAYVATVWEEMKLEADVKRDMWWLLKMDI